MLPDFTTTSAKTVHKQFNLQRVQILRTELWRCIKPASFYTGTRHCCQSLLVIVVSSLFSIMKLTFVQKDAKETIVENGKAVEHAINLQDGAPAQSPGSQSEGEKPPYLLRYWVPVLTVVRKLSVYFIITRGESFLSI